MQNGHGFGRAFCFACAFPNRARIFKMKCESSSVRERRSIELLIGGQLFRRVLPVGTGRCLPNSRVALQPLGFNSLALLASLDTKVFLTSVVVDLK